MEVTGMGLSKHLNFEKVACNQKNLKNGKCCCTVPCLIYFLWVLHKFSRIKAYRSISGPKSLLWAWHGSSSGYTDSHSIPFVQTDEGGH